MSIGTIDRRASEGITSVGGFAAYKGTGTSGVFVRLVGVNESFERDVAAMDMLCGGSGYDRISSLPNFSSAAESDRYEKAYENWVSSKGTGSIVIGITEGNPAASSQLAGFCPELLRLFRSAHPNSTPSVEKNFMIRLLFRLDKVLKDIPLFKGAKLVGCNASRLHDYLFYYAAARLGVNVLLLQYSSDLDESTKKLGLSAYKSLGRFDNIRLPEYNNKNYGSAAPPSSPVFNQGMIKVVIPPRKNRRSAVTRPSAENYGMPAVSRPSGSIINRTPAAPQAVSVRPELSYEQLARLAPGVVQILVASSVNDVGRNGNINARASGSGVMIGRDGYIVTNFHVAKRGRVYGIRIENDDRIYFTDRIVKYHDVYDLAVLKIDRRLEPLRVYQGSQPLVRGQRVVAIGSPLGMFNTVSDGIISGFRTVDGVGMIQFTAPISSGSSGGALLNMHGEIIGISTAGIESESTVAQNLNLAVGYETLLSFCRNIIE